MSHQLGGGGGGGGGGGRLVPEFPTVNKGASTSVSLSGDSSGVDQIKLA